MAKAKPVKASAVTPKTDKTKDELRRQQVQESVKGRLAKRSALRKMGATGLGSPANIGDIDRRLKGRDQQQMDRFREGKR